MTWGWKSAVALAFVVAAGCGDDGGNDPIADAAQTVDANGGGPDAVAAPDGAAAGGTVCKATVDGTEYVMEEVAMATHAGDLITGSCNGAGRSMSFSINTTGQSTLGPGTHICKDGVVAGMIELGFGTSGGDQWSSRNATMTNGSCTYTITELGDRFVGTVEGVLHRRAGSGPDTVTLTLGSFDIPLP